MPRFHRAKRSEDLKHLKAKLKKLEDKSGKDGAKAGELQVGPRPQEAVVWAVAGAYRSGGGQQLQEAAAEGLHRCCSVLGSNSCPCRTFGIKPAKRESR